MNELETAYINKISLKNYKSIRDLTIDLHPGLNIMIGQNGSGKTNFVQAIHSIFSEELHHILPIDFEFAFEITNKNNPLIKWTGKIKEMVLENKKNRIRKIYESNIESPTIHADNFLHPTILNFFDAEKINLIEHEFIKFGLDANIAYLDKAKAIEVKVKGNTTYLYMIDDNNLENWFHTSYFLTMFLDKLTPKNIEKNFKVNEALVSNLKRFSPIKDCRFAKSYTIEKQKNSYMINHVILEFFVNNNWYSWEQLSDGTKRLFYIISQTINNQSFVIIEEPEIGLHPDQLFRIMDFLKAQAESKQIIVTTHSPDALNILEKDELHKIIVTRFDEQKGTLMHHLSPKKIAKAHRYMNTEGLELKDFWLHSNLEELDEAK
jgi:predicted ATP-dependent endonuclease of OLD family